MAPILTLLLDAFRNQLAPAVDALVPYAMDALHRQFARRNSEKSVKLVFGLNELVRDLS